VGSRVVDVRCPGCGSPWSTSEAYCKYCGRQVIINSMSDLISMDARTLKAHTRVFEDALDLGSDDPSIHSSLGMCFLKLGLRSKALEHFEKAMVDDIENSETYFFAAIAELDGKKPFLATLSMVRTAEEYLTAALRLEDRGIYSYFFAYLRFDYYERKSLNCQPGYETFLDDAFRNNVTNLDIQNLFELLGVDRTTVAIPTQVA
jgi:tetratricopeptide (TPR) repeat protein